MYTVYQKQLKVGKINENLIRRVISEVGSSQWLVSNETAIPFGTATLNATKMGYQEQSSSFLRVQQIFGC